MAVGVSKHRALVWNDGATCTKGKKHDAAEKADLSEMADISLRAMTGGSLRPCRAMCSRTRATAQGAIVR